MERVKYNEEKGLGLKVGLKAAIDGLRSGVQQAIANKNVKLAGVLEQQLHKLYKIDTAVLDAVCTLQEENGGQI